jgi:hypothetical protein
MQEHRHSGARALRANPESKNTERDQWLGPVSMVSVPGPDGPSRNDARLFSSLLERPKFVNDQRLDEN